MRTELIILAPTVHSWLYFYENGDVRLAIDIGISDPSARFSLNTEATRSLHAALCRFLDAPQDAQPPSSPVASVTQDGAS